MAATLMRIAWMSASSMARYSCLCGWCHMYDKDTKLRRAHTYMPQKTACKQCTLYQKWV